MSWSRVDQPLWRRVLWWIEWNVVPWTPLYRGRRDRWRCLGPLPFARVLWSRVFGVSSRRQAFPKKPRERFLSVDVLDSGESR